MDGHRQIREIEIAQLDLRYAPMRIERPKEGLALAASIERAGQLVPVVVTKTFVLLDGYLRVKAMKHCGRDTVRAEMWDCTEEEALREILARAHGRKWELVEEAALVRELYDRHHLSQERIASLVGRTQGCPLLSHDAGQSSKEPDQRRSGWICYVGRELVSKVRILNEESAARTQGPRH